jgi:hypothetical protein
LKIKNDDAMSSLIRTLYTTNATKSSDLEMAFRLIRILAKDVESLTKAFEKLPGKQEFVGVKQELTSVKTIVDDVIVPLKKALEEAKKRDVRGDEVYT